MLLLTLSGTAMLAERLGGWRRLLGPIRGTASRRIHGELGRVAVAGLVLSAATGLLFVARDLRDPPRRISPEAPVAEASGGPARAVGALPALKAVDLVDLRALSFPIPAIRPTSSP